MSPPFTVFRSSFTVGLLCWGVSLVSLGCSVGPHYVRGSRTQYNRAIQKTASEEMLLNLVRARYGEPPEFLAVSGITSQFEVNGLVGFGNEFGIGNGRWTGTLNAADRPTISLTPLQDEQFTRRFVSPVGLETIYLFSRNGRRMEKILRLAVEEINGVKNTPENCSVDATPSPFMWLAQTLEQLARQQQVELAYDEIDEKLSPPVKDDSIEGSDLINALDKGYQFQTSGAEKSVFLTGKKKNLTLRISSSAVSSPELEGVTELLHIKPAQTNYRLEAAVEGQLKSRAMPHDELHISTRSVEEILHFLCHGVSVPPRHIEEGRVAHRNGMTICCAEPTSDLLRVCCSKRRPHGAVVAVHYRDHWFWIDDADATSKETFELLLELYNLEIRGGGAAGLPVLTLPLGR